MSMIRAKQKKKHKPQYTLGPSSTLWPVFEDGFLIALCTDSQVAMLFAEMLRLRTLEKRSTTK